MTLLEDLTSNGLGDLARSLTVVEQNVRDRWDGRNNLWWFTDHGPGHSERVVALAQQMMDHIAYGSGLSPLESYLLLASAWVHDIGMQSGHGGGSVDQADSIRSGHAEESQRLVGSGEFGIGTTDRVIVDLVARIAGSHSTSRYLGGLGELRPVRQVRSRDVRLRLLSAMLLFADELDLSLERVPRLEAGQTIDPLSQAHWLKHECVGNVHLSRSRHDGTVLINLEMLRAPNLPKSDERAIERWIVGKLQQQLVLVEREFLPNGLRFSSQPVIEWTDCEPPLANYSAEAMAHIHDEVARLELINHSDCLKQTTGAILGGQSVRITGPLDKQSIDLSGREDVFAATIAKVRASGWNVVELPNPEPGTDARTIGDVLGSIASLLGLTPTAPAADQDEHSIRAANEEVLQAWLNSPADRQVLAISSLDLVPKVTRKPLVSWLVRASAAGKVVLVTEGGAVADSAHDWKSVPVGATAVSESQDYIARLFGRDKAAMLVDDSQSYADIKRIYGRAVVRTLERSA